MTVKSMHHVAYRCRDAKQTVEFYQRNLGLEYTIGFAENEVPSTGEWSPHAHVFLKLDDGSHLAFFELPESPAMQLDPNTPDWVQHIAMTVADEETLLAYKQRLEANGVEVVGPTDHKMCKSIYFFDPSGHRMELTVNTMTLELTAALQRQAQPLLEEWSKTKRAPDVSWLHENARR
jgi:catechol 2,3-dioxygenase-like lactoylglutathione lyase family enzyme